VPFSRQREERAMLNALLGRQPIVDRAGALVAYELLFRSAGNSS
jgi:c-di-GMP-related signal transduction protein